MILYTLKLNDKLMEIKIECSKYSDIDLHLTILVLFAMTSKIVLFMLCKNNNVITLI